MPTFIPLLLLLLLSTPPHASATASPNGLIPSMDMPMNLAQGTTLPYLHFSPGDVLWLQGWVPGRDTTLFGACVGLFVLGLLYRWVIALRAALEVGIVGVRTPHPDSHPLATTHQNPSSLLDKIILRNAPPFILRHALSRGLLYMIQVSIGFLFMLAAMTFQVSFILSIVIGQGVGEMMYGRYTDAARQVVHFHGH